MEAFLALEQTEIPAIVTDLSEEDSLVSGLVENVARSKPLKGDLFRAIGDLVERGYSDAKIGAKIGYSATHVGRIRRLLKAGEERLLLAVETGKMPLGVAVAIAEAKDGRAQEILVEAYENGELTLSQMPRARSAIEHRERYGKALKRDTGERKPASKSYDALTRSLKEAVRNHGALIASADTASEHLRVLVQGLRTLLSERPFPDGSSAPSRCRHCPLLWRAWSKPGRRRDMAGKVTIGFEPESVTIPITDILPLRLVDKTACKRRKFRQIAASIREIGIVQPPIVARRLRRETQVSATRRPSEDRSSEGPRYRRSRLSGLSRRRGSHLQSPGQPSLAPPGAQDDPEGHRARGTRGTHRASAERQYQDDPRQTGPSQRHLSRGCHAPQGQALPDQLLPGAQEGQAPAAIRDRKDDGRGRRLHGRLRRGLSSRRVRRINW